ncbi:Exocyst complex component S3A [Trifolium repens]|nr:Exocyst complex component S3A [Trifolium repens]
MLKSSLSGEGSINAIYKKLQKNLTSEELLPSLWDKFKKEFLDKYESFTQLVAKIYPNETILSVADISDIRANITNLPSVHGVKFNVRWLLYMVRKQRQK